MKYKPSFKNIHVLSRQVRRSLTGLLAGIIAVTSLTSTGIAGLAGVSTLTGCSTPPKNQQQNSQSSGTGQQGNQNSDSKQQNKQDSSSTHQNEQDSGTRQQSQENDAFEEFAMEVLSTDYRRI